MTCLNSGVLLGRKRGATSIHLLVAERAIKACAFFLMAIDATRHIDLFGLVHLLQLFDLAVTIGTRAASFHMRAMTEIHVRRNLVHAPPFDLTILFGIRRELLNFLALGLHIRMAFHAQPGSCQAHLLAGVRILVTGRAFQLLCARV